jgi:hypothetical protein
MISRGGSWFLASRDQNCFPPGVTERKPNPKLSVRPACQPCASSVTSQRMSPAASPTCALGPVQSIDGWLLQVSVVSSHAPSTWPTSTVFTPE